MKEQLQKALEKIKALPVSFHTENTWIGTKYTPLRLCLIDREKVCEILESELKAEIEKEKEVNLQKNYEDTMKKIHSLLKDGMRLAAIKTHYEYSGRIFLKDSKKVVDEIWEKNYKHPTKDTEDESPKYPLSDRDFTMTDKIEGKKNKTEKTISDGCGSEWLLKCPECGRNSMQVVRPGKAQCKYCG